MILNAKALLDGNPHPAEKDIKGALSGNFCRRISHDQVVEEAILDVLEDNGSGWQNSGHTAPSPQKPYPT